MSGFSDLINALRPAHWIKNFLVLAPVFFTGRIAEPRTLLPGLLVSAVFCAAASAVYLFNDWWDAPADRQDPRKKMRPYAAGRIPESSQKLLMAVCAAVAAAGCAILPMGAAGMVIAYVVGMVLYTVLFKRWWAVGAAVISLGMIARVFAGAAAIHVCVSAWVLPCTFFLTCYVVAGKRLFDASGAGDGVDAMLNGLFLAFGAASVVCYVFYAFTDITIQKYASRWVIISAAPVALGVWRYAALVRRPRPYTEHFQAVVTDPVMAVSLCAWLAVFAAIIYRG